MWGLCFPGHPRAGVTHGPLGRGARQQPVTDNPSSFPAPEDLPLIYSAWETQISPWEGRHSHFQLLKGHISPAIHSALHPILPHAPVLPSLVGTHTRSI